MTALQVILALWSDEIGFRAKLGSRKEELVDGNLDSLFANLRFQREQLPEFLKPPVLDQTLLLTNLLTGGEIAGEATNPGFGRGGRRRVILLDEMAHILPAKQQDEVVASLRSVAASNWYISSPKDKTGKFFKLWRDLPSASVFESDWKADPRRPSDFPATTMVEEGMTQEEFDREFGAKFVNLLRTGRVYTVRRPLVEFYDDAPEWTALDRPKERFPIVGMWDFGSGRESDLVCILALVELRKNPRIWIVDEFVWNQTSWRVAAADVRLLVHSRGYRGTEVHYGDPAGKQRDAGQESWQTHLRAGRVNMICLDEIWNTRQGIEWSLRETNALFADAQLRVHRRCVAVWDMLDNWTRDVPEGEEVAEVNKVYIPPRHDGYSHPGNALRYGIAGILQSIARARRSDRDKRAAAKLEEQEEGQTVRDPNDHGDPENPLAGWRLV